MSAGWTGPTPGTAPLDAPILAALKDRVPDVAGRTVEAVTTEVAEYAGALSDPMLQSIREAVQMAMAGFLKLAGSARDAGTPLGPTLEGAYAVGRGQARAGLSMDALLAAYRVGARTAWRDLARTAAGAGLSSNAMADFAELLFAYIDALSASSAAGHTDELTVSGRVRERYRELLARQLLAGADEESLLAGAEQAGWQPPGSLTAVILPSAQARTVLSAVTMDPLQLGADLPGLESADRDQGLTALLVPDADGPGRRQLLRALAGRHAIVGPSRPWTRVRSSYELAARTAGLHGGLTGPGPVDSTDHLVELVVGADPDALADLRVLALEPLSGLPAATRHRLAETLLSWLLHQGRREDVAAHLHVHPQTVRYRMGQLRELYGDRLSDPRTVHELILALSPVEAPGS